VHIFPFAINPFVDTMEASYRAVTDPQTHTERSEYSFSQYTPVKFAQNLAHDEIDVSSLKTVKALEWQISSCTMKLRLLGRVWKLSCMNFYVIGRSGAIAKVKPASLQFVPETKPVQNIHASNLPTNCQRKRFK
jgi:hypothetical protein